MQFPILEIPPVVASALLSALSFLYAVLTGLMAGGAVFMLVAQKRGAGSIELRWDDLARRIATWVLNLTLSGVALSGISLWMVFIFVNPKAAAHLQSIFFGPLLAGWVFLTCGVVLLAVYVFYWDRWRDRPGVHFTLGTAGAVCLWLATAMMVSVKSFTLTSGGWPASASLWRAVLNPSIVPAYLLWAASAMILAGSVGLIYARFQKDNLWRECITQGTGTITAGAAMAGSVACLAWLIVLSFAGNLDGMGDEIPPIYFGAGVVVIAVELSILLVLTAVRRPENFGNVLCAIAVVSVVTLVAGIQAVQDKSQGPFLIQSYMYRNGILVSEVEKLQEKGLWKPVAWMPEKEGAPRNGSLGAYNFQVQCRVCHAGWHKTGPSSGLPAFKFEGDALRYLDQISSRHPFFPVFAGSGQEKRAVALYIEGLLKNSGVSLASRPAEAPRPAKKKKKTIKAIKNQAPASPLPIPPQTENTSGDDVKTKTVPENPVPSPPAEEVKAAPEASGGVSPQPPNPAAEKNIKVPKTEGSDASESGETQVQKTDADPGGSGSPGGARQVDSPGAASSAPKPADPAPAVPETKSGGAGAGGEKQ